MTKIINQNQPAVKLSEIYLLIVKDTDPLEKRFA